MTREEAIRILASSCIPGSKQTEALETLIPELAESEDERIRKEIIDIVEAYRANCVYEGIHRFDDCLAYLEKQKAKEKQDRMMPVYNDRDSFESALDKAWKSYNESGARTVDSCEDDYVECAHAKGFREGYLFGLEKQKEQKPVESISQLTVQGKGVYKICPRCKERMVRDDSMVYTSMPPQYRYECPKCGESECDTVMYDNPEKQKEQKPAGLSEMMVHKEPYIAPVPTPIVADEQKPIDYDAELEKCKHNFLYFWDKYVIVKLKKPKWSKEDEEMLQSIIKDFRDGNISSIGQEQWLKSLPLNLKKKNEDVAKLCSNEWSEEDEKMIKEALYCVGYTFGNTHPLVTWLKSLRPHWKPSEEQMEVLKDYADSAIDSQRDIEGNILFSLYDDLKKLTESNFDPKVPSIKEAVIKIVKSISPKVLEYEGFSREQVVKWLYDKEE